jgi:hypothetical protein
MSKKCVAIYVIIAFINLMLWGITIADSPNKSGEVTTWIRSTDVQFDGSTAFQMETMGTMADMIAKYKKKEKGLKIFAVGNILDKDGRSLEYFDNVPAQIVTIGGSDYFQFDKGKWRLRSRADLSDTTMKVFTRKD